jgi:hypothetical protein
MSLIEIHAGLARTASLFLAVLAVWAILLRIRTRPLDSNWYGAAVIGEILLIAQFLLGWVLFFQFGGGALPRPYLHILYGLVAVIALPAGYAYFSRLEDEGVKTVAMAVTCIFLWGIVSRATNVATISLAAHWANFL